jgi:hypothetical protein
VRPPQSEFVLLVAIAAHFLSGRRRVRTGRARQSIDRTNQGGRWQIQNAFAGPNQILGGLRTAAESEHATPAKPPCRRHRREIERAVFVAGANQNDRRSKIKNGWLDLDV